MTLETLLSNFWVIENLHTCEGVSISIKRGIKKVFKKGQSEIKEYSEVLQEKLKEYGMKAVDNTSLLKPYIVYEDATKQALVETAYSKPEKELSDLEKGIIEELNKVKEEIQEQIKEYFDKELKDFPSLTLIDEDLDRIKINVKRKNKDGEEYDEKREILGIELSSLEELGFIQE